MEIKTLNVKAADLRNVEAEVVVTCVSRSPEDELRLGLPETQILRVLRVLSQTRGRVVLKFYLHEILVLSPLARCTESKPFATTFWPKAFSCGFGGADTRSSPHRPPPPLPHRGAPAPAEGRMKRISMRIDSQNSLRHKNSMVHVVCNSKKWRTLTHVQASASSTPALPLPSDTQSPLALYLSSTTSTFACIVSKHQQPMIR